jgi:hypothetical protein
MRLDLALSPARAVGFGYGCLLLLAASSLTACPPEERRRARAGGHGRADPGLPDEPQHEDESGPLCKTHNVDLLFVIDNSGSMSQEQAKLAQAVPQLLGILATGNHSGKRSVAGEPTDFAPAGSIHVGVISTDMGVNGAPPQKSCGSLSFVPAERDPQNTTTFLSKPMGDDGQLLTSTAVAVAGITAPLVPGGEPVELVPPDPSCRDLMLEQPYLEYEPGDLFEDTGAAFSCISKLGKNGCGLEQQLESMLKALTPNASRDFRFTQGTGGQGTAPGTNAGFLRDDAVLAVIHISDEEDCSSPDTSNGLFDAMSTLVFAGEINVRCSMPENQKWLHPVRRYVDGLRALKPARYQDRILFAGVVGVPLAEEFEGSEVHSGRGQLREILKRADMQFATRRNAAGIADEPVPVCESKRGDGTAAPGRRFLEVAGELGDNGLVTSICEDSYQPLVTSLSERIAPHLGSDCEE